MTTTIVPQFDRLVAAWEDHHRARMNGSPLAELSKARARLDDVRLDVRRSVRSR